MRNARTRGSRTNSDSGALLASSSPTRGRSIGASGAAANSGLVAAAGRPGRDYAAWLAREPLADRTKQDYARWVRSFAAWAASAREAVDWGGDPLTDPVARDYAAREFTRWLQVERRLAPASVNL